MTSSQDTIIRNKLFSLKNSKFRLKFELTQKDRDYTATRGLATINDHAFDFVNSRGAPDFPKNDGKQSPMQGGSMKRTLILIMIVLTVAFAAIAGDNPKIEMDTTRGKIVLELYADKAPKTVKNFLAYLDAGFYYGTIFHSVIPGFMIHGGNVNTADLAIDPDPDPADQASAQPDRQSECREHVVDISLGGALITMACHVDGDRHGLPFQVGDELEEVDLVFPSAPDATRVKIKKAIVVRFDQKGPNTGVCCGLEFIEIEQKQVNTLTEFFYKFQRDRLRNRLRPDL